MRIWLAYRGGGVAALLVKSESMVLVVMACFSGLGAEPTDTSTNIFSSGLFGATGISFSAGCAGRFVSRTGAAGAVVAMLLAQLSGA